jgi:serine O-acetyltransferase
MLGRLLAGIDAMLAWLPPSPNIAGLVTPAMRQVLADEALDDLCALATRDAAAGGDIDHVYDSYASYHAVLAYRVAHRVLCLPDQDLPLRTAARRLSERAKVSTGVEIHPAAVIGRRLVIDHGYGTVVGEQTRIGDDCYRG